MTFTCHRCNKVCKTGRGLTNHMKVCLKNLINNKKLNENKCTCYNSRKFCRIHGVKWVQRINRTL